jgi:hypothetical protein
LSLLKDTEYIDQKSFIPGSNDCEELIKILISSILTAKKSLKKE